MSKANDSRTPDLKLGLKQHTLNKYMPSGDFCQVSIWFKNPSPALQAEIAQHVEDGTITCLLYTSPSPRD